MALFQTAKKAADAAVESEAGGPEEERCVDALKKLREFPVSSGILVATQVIFFFKVNKRWVLGFGFWICGFGALDECGI